MHNPKRNRPYCIYEALANIPGGWSMRCLIGGQLHERHEFVPAPSEDSDMVLARAHAAGEAWCVANGGEPAGAPSPIDGWVQGMVQTMNELNGNPELRHRLSKRGF